MVTRSTPSLATLDSTTRSLHAFNDYSAAKWTAHAAHFQRDVQLLHELKGLMDSVVKHTRCPLPGVRAPRQLTVAHRAIKDKLGGPRGADRAPETE